jgi:hypothetical protein
MIFDCLPSSSMFLIRTNYYELLEIWQQMDGWFRNSVIHQHSNILKLWLKAKFKEYETFLEPNIWFPNNIGGFKFKAFYKDAWNYFKDETQLMKNTNRVSNLFNHNQSCTTIWKYKLNIDLSSCHIIL